MYEQKSIIKTCFYLIIICCGISSSCCNRRSAIYVDNGQQQSAVEHWFSKVEEVNFEEDMRKLLGIRYQFKENEGKLNKKKSAPQFMLNVYNNIVERKSDKSNEFHLKSRDWKKINKSDVIISFMAQQPNKGPGEKPDRVKRMWFDVSEMTDDDDIMLDADLRLYMEPTINNHAYNQQKSSYYTLIVERVLRLDDGQREFFFVDSVNVRPNYRGWIALNVTESLHYWMINPEENRGLRISVTYNDNIEIIQPEKIGIIGFDGEPAKQPFMAGYYKNSGKRGIQLRINNISKRNKRSTTDFYSGFDDFMDIIQSREKITTPCSRNKWYLSFQSIAWQDFILEPEGYDAYFCEGECDFPNGPSVDTTNHAIIQALLHLRYPDLMPKPCCVPTKLSDLSVLYFQNENNVVYKVYKNMIVDKCGCH